MSSAPDLLVRDILDGPAGTSLRAIARVSHIAHGDVPRAQFVK